jgi:hypothetical protein
MMTAPNRKPGPPISGLGGLSANKRLAEQAWRDGYQQAKRESMIESGVRVAAALLATGVILIGRKRDWWGG